MKPTEAGTSVGWWRSSARYPFFRVVNPSRLSIRESAIGKNHLTRRISTVVTEIPMRYRVTCTTNHPNGERITHLGCVTSTSLYQFFSEEEAIARLESGDTFYVERPASHIAEVVIARREGRKYLKTEPDGEKPDNLLSLPDCPARKSDKPSTVRTVMAAGSHCFSLPLRRSTQ
jgi:hypothetical protein